jgi:uncharacterized protein YidB (DUF937 family)
LSDNLGNVLENVLENVLKGLAGQAGQPGQTSQGTAQQGGLADILAQALSKTDFGSLGGLVQQLAQSGLAAQVASWLGNGQNLPVSIDQIRNALGDQNLAQLARQFGLPAEEVLRHLANHLPGAVDALSPKGTLAKDLGPE